MLRHLRVTNFAILSDVTLELGPGFNVLTGETGAGKSLIVEAVNLLRGGRASADIPRAGAREAVVEAIFEPPEDLRPRIAAVLAEAGIEPGEDDEVVVRRVIQRGGRGRVYVNGALTTARRLAEVGALLCDLSGQHQHQGLVDSARHREILDAYADQSAKLAEMAEAHEAWRRARTALEGHRDRARGASDRADYLRFQLDEIATVDPRPGEDEQLSAERARLQSVDRLEAGARTALELVYSGDDAAVDRLGAAARELERLRDADPALAEVGDQLEEARVLADEAARSLRHYAEKLEADPGRLAEVEDRLAALDKLLRKHGGSLAAVLERSEELAHELSAIDDYDGELASLEQAEAAAEKAARRVAAALSKLRRKAGARLAEAVSTAIADLGMARAALEVAFEDTPLGAHGTDRVELLLAANPGEPAKPLTKIASGGELSRIMLALKLVLRRADEVATYVFDEVDAGVGGTTAEVVGRQIRAVADQRQVLCVTHLAPIAVFADHHFQVTKLERDGRTETLVQKLTERARRDETARMIGGTPTKRARAHADEMLSAARR